MKPINYLLAGVLRNSDRNFGKIMIVSIMIVLGGIGVFIIVTLWPLILALRDSLIWLLRGLYGG